MSLQKTWKKIIMAALILIAVIFLVLVVAHFTEPLIKILKDSDQVRVWAEGKGLIGRLIFTLAMALQVIVAVIPGGPLQISAGIAYGALQGFIIVMAGIMAGSSLSFLLVRRYGRRVIQLFFSAEKIDGLRILRDERRLNTLTFIFFLIPGTPKDLLSYGLGLTQMPFKTWFTITLLARIPAVLASSLTGNALLEKEYGFAAAIFLGVTIFSALGYWGYLRYNEHKTDKQLHP